jgi:integrase
MARLSILRSFLSRPGRVHAAPQQYVFQLEGEKVGDFRKSWNTACTQIETPGLLFHDLRRSAVRNMVRAGISERVAMTISGHKTRNVFDRYHITSQDDLREAAQKRHEFYALPAGRLQNSYNRPPKAQKVTALKAVTS